MSRLCPARPQAFQLLLNGIRFVICHGFKEPSFGGRCSTKTKLNMTGSNRRLFLSLNSLKRTILIQPNEHLWFQDKQKYFEYLLCARCCAGIGSGG